jgi:selenocysteine-specific elongation factor
MIIATSGHVDHGKTSLVRSLTNIETDNLEEEKARGLTIDLGYAYIQQEKTDDSENNLSIGFVDVPGHSRFISNMLAGVAGIDFGLLVIAADDGPMPQTLEHLAILDLLGISKGIIALTKIDRVDDERINVVKNQIKELVMGTLLADADILEVSSTNGDGIEKLKKELWRHAEEHQSQPIEGYFRLAIDRKFSIKGAGLVVTGSVYSGTVSENDDLWLLPSRSPVRVRSIRRQNASASRGFSGDRCAINITGDFDRSLISRGSWLSNTPDLPLTNRIDAKIKILRDETKPLKNGTPVHVHCGAAHATGRLATLDDSARSKRSCSIDFGRANERLLGRSTDYSRSSC